MDTKYIINTMNVNGKQKIRWVGIITDKNERPEIIPLTNQDAADVEGREDYYDQLHKIDDGKFFADFIMKRNYTVTDENIYDVDDNAQAQAPTNTTPAPVVVKEKTSNKAAIATLVITGLLAASAVGYGAGANDLAAKAFFGKKAKAQTEQTNEKESTTEEETNAEDLENKSVEELVNMLNSEKEISEGETVNVQKAYKTIVDVQDHFNFVAAPTVKQKAGKRKMIDENGNVVEKYFEEQQPYVTFDETVAAYMYANAKTMSSKKLATILGTGKILVKNLETGEYEEFNNKDQISASFLKYCINQYSYYLLGATKHTKTNELFNNEDENKYFYDWESLVLEYNKTKSPETKAKLRAKYEELYMSGSVDPLFEKFPGAAAMIGTAITPWAYQNDIIDTDMYKSIVEINEKVVCQDIYGEIEKITEYVKVNGDCGQALTNGDERIIEKLARLQNEKLIKLNREDIDFRNAVDGYTLDGLDIENQVIGISGFYTTTTSSTVVKTYRSTKQVSRAEAVKKFGEKRVREAEQRAEQAANKEINDKNKKQEDYWTQFQKDYNKAYDDTMNGRTNDSNSDGSKAGRKAANEDKAQMEKDKDNYQDPTEEIITDEGFVPENNNTNNNGNNNSNTGNESMSNDPAPVSTPNDEIIDEGFVPETNVTYNSNSTNQTQSAPKAESKEEKDDTETMDIETSDGTKYRSAIRVRKI